MNAPTTCSQRLPRHRESRVLMNLSRWATLLLLTIVGCNPNKGPMNGTTINPAPPNEGIVPVQSPRGIGTAVAGTVVQNSLGMNLVVVPAGKFRFGSSPVQEGEPSSLTNSEESVILRPFLVGRFEVTQDEYLRVMNRSPSYFSQNGQGNYRLADLDTRQHPVDSVSWHDAVEFCEALNHIPAEQAAGWSYRLPTEVEWEYASRATTSTAYHSGSQLSPGDANVDFRTDQELGGSPLYLGRTEKVGQYPPNLWGLFDCHGNVSEWCHPSDNASPFFAPLKGGNWRVPAELAQSGTCDDRQRNARDRFIGFRIVADVSN